MKQLPKKKSVGSNRHIFQCCTNKWKLLLNGNTYLMVDIAQETVSLSLKIEKGCVW